jgi:hypothetical protein
MKKIFLSVFVLFFIAISPMMAMSKRKMSTKKLPYTGTIVNFPKGSGSYVIVPDDEPNKRLCVETMDSRFKKDGMKIEFIGVETPSKINAKLKAANYRLKMIQEKR